MTTKEKRLVASFHGHSPYSDGLSSIPDLVRSAARARMNFFGISDHNTTDGIRTLYQEIARVNDTNGASIIPVSAVEITTNQGDLLIARPGDLDKDFLEWGNRWSNERKKHGVAETIRTAVRSFNAVAVVVHSGEPWLHGVPFDVVRKLPETIDEKTLLNVGLELHNWSAQLLPRRAKIRELVVAKIAFDMNFAQFGFSDFHHAWQIPKQFTFVETNNATSDGLISAVQERKVSPNKGAFIWPGSWLRLCLIFATTHFQHPNFTK